MPVETKQVPSLDHLAQQYAAEMVSMQPSGPFLLIGSGLGSSLVAAAVAHALTLLTHKSLLVGPMKLETLLWQPAAQLSMNIPCFIPMSL